MFKCALLFKCLFQNKKSFADSTPAMHNNVKPGQSPKAPAAYIFKDSRSIIFADVIGLTRGDVSMELNFSNYLI
jgi:hypothetical protein